MLLLLKPSRCFYFTVPLFVYHIASVKQEQQQSEKQNNWVDPKLHLINDANQFINSLITLLLLFSQLVFAFTAFTLNQLIHLTNKFYFTRTLKSGEVGPL